VPSLQENKRMSNKDLAVVRLRVSPPIGRLWDGAVTASNIAPKIAPNIATTKTRRAPCVLFATYRPHSVARFSIRLCRGRFRSTIPELASGTPLESLR
jgi:ribosomal protein S14